MAAEKTETEIEPTIADAPKSITTSAITALLVAELDATKTDLTDIDFQGARRGMKTFLRQLRGTEGAIRDKKHLGTSHAIQGAITDALNKRPE